MLNDRSRALRLQAIDLMKTKGGTHFGGTFSSAEILINLYDKALRTNDIFILSKGHSCWIYYLLLMEKGFSPRIENHPHYDPSNGIFCTTGSMGHGFPIAVGQATAKLLQQNTGRVFVLLGDGECQEGTTWESLLLASKLKLRNLVVIIDNNDIQATGKVSEILPVLNPLKAAAKSLFWEVSEIDGHSLELLDVLNQESNNPKLIIAKTLKGKGVSFMEDNPSWHSKWLDSTFEAIAKGELT